MGLDNPLHIAFLLIIALLVFPIIVRAQEPAIFEPGAKLKIEAEGEGGGEGPAWHPKLGVFTSGGDGHLHLLGLDGKQSIFRKKAGTNGLLDDLEVEDCRPFEAELYKFLDNSKPAILATIRDKKTIDDALKADLTAAINEVKGSMVKHKPAVAGARA